MGNSFFIVGLTILCVSGCVSSPKSQSPAPVPVSVTAPTVEVSYELAPVKSCFSLSAVGDIMLGGSTQPLLEKHGYDYPFENVTFLENADVLMGNLETALTHGGEPFEKQFNFRNPPEKVTAALKNAGFDLVSLANNHTMDYGVEGLNDTLMALQSADIAYVGAGDNSDAARAAHIMNINGTQVATLGYSNTFPDEFWATDTQPGTAFGREAHIRADVAKAISAGAEFVVVQFHWGREGTTELRDYQVTLAKAAIDAGAKLVIGHHPHVVQAIEHYGEGIIYYSLGNFAFGSYSNRVETGGIAQVNVCDSAITKASMALVAVNNFKVHMQPTLLEKENLNHWFKKLQKISEAQHTTLKLENEEIVVIFNEGVS